MSEIKRGQFCIISLRLLFTGVRFVTRLGLCVWPLPPESSALA